MVKEKEANKEMLVEEGEGKRMKQKDTQIVIVISVLIKKMMVMMLIVFIHNIIMIQIMEGKIKIILKKKAK